MTAWLLLVLAHFFEVAASLSLRASKGLKKKVWIIPLAVCYAAAFGILAVILVMSPPIGTEYGI